MLSSNEKCRAMPESTRTYICVECLEGIVDHVYLVKRRKVRPIPKNAPSSAVERIKLGILFDAVDTSHGGIIVGPEEDSYCPTCYAKLPSVKELINAYKSGLDKTS